VIYRYLDCGNLHNGFALLKKLVTNGIHCFFELLFLFSCMCTDARFRLYLITIGPIDNDWKGVGFGRRRNFGMKGATATQLIFYF
jgi:hypothetical protein